jgi:hypothetical protein
VVLLDDLEERPQAQIDAIVQFLGLRTLPSSGDLRRRVNSAREGNEQIGRTIRDKLKEIYCGPNRELAELLRRDLSHWS